MSPLWLPFEDDGGRLYFSYSSSGDIQGEINPRASSETDTVSPPVFLPLSLFSVELEATLCNDGVCREFELARR